MKHFKALVMKALAAQPGKTAELQTELGVLGSRFDDLSDIVLNPRLADLTKRQRLQLLSKAMHSLDEEVPDYFVLLQQHAIDIALKAALPVLASLAAAKSNIPTMFDQRSSVAENVFMLAKYYNEHEGWNILCSKRRAHPPSDTLLEAMEYAKAIEPKLKWPEISAKGRRSSRRIVQFFHKARVEARELCAPNVELAEHVLRGGHVVVTRHVEAVVV